MIVERRNNYHIIIPISMVADWEKKYGREDIVKTFPRIQRAVEAIDELLSTNSLQQNVIPGQLALRIQNPNFSRTDFGRFVQAAILAGYQIDAEKFFHGSGASWDKSKKFGVKVKKVSVLSERDSDNNWLVCIEISYRKDSFSVVKTMSDLLKLLY